MAVIASTLPVGDAILFSRPDVTQIGQHGQRWYGQLRLQVQPPEHIDLICQIGQIVENAQEFAEQAPREQGEHGEQQQR